MEIAGVAGMADEPSDGEPVTEELAEAPAEPTDGEPDTAPVDVRRRKRSSQKRQPALDDQSAAEPVEGAAAETGESPHDEDSRPVHEHDSADGH